MRLVTKTPDLYLQSIREGLLRDFDARCEVDVMELDLESFDSVRRFCNHFNKRHIPLHLLVCNAGEIYIGYRLHQINYLAYHTNLKIV